ncbi:hypothetical protein COT78_00995 [Candidatus Berkelbacteria bacterium CG10_big_fil_rev_8_21_14_0_10_43_13]|uniref:Peptidase S11 D-alanyl-D-alanine carboxypeptidase A N-terminal domain-containing protein n=1 Tax=Candidatus Berkelbacteria bacterium CG10_big_fil_rev_8_21_14_0_10_43_13 TaxID=1974514 RepID=A0A2H0W756_9BACT|nr:MAG: hypothetical protein COT78_00995 [Candidatus Berkelbacteria bacterium CG10_big_fil_rev_8_21_14_0_10_43_13]
MKKTELKSAASKAARPNNLSTVVSVSVVIILVLAYLVTIAFTKASVSPTLTEINTTGYAETKIVWPAYGQAAVGAVGYGVLANSGEQVAHPIASIAKIVLALSVLEKKPLEAGQSGPSYQITSDDVQYYYDDLAVGGSLLPVNDGEVLTEYQMLQGLLIASGDNIATTLAVWAFGSMENYLAYANKMAADNGWSATHMADASGLSDQTVSSAVDLVKIGDKALSHSVLAEIVNQQQADLPIAGTVNNYNTILGKDGVIGIKTGNTPEAGGCLLFAVKNATDSDAPVMVGAILGAPSRLTVLRDTTNFIQSNASNFRNINVVKAGNVVGKYETAWGQSIKIIAKDDLNYYTVDNKKITPAITLDKINSSKSKNSEVGTVLVNINGQTKSTSAILNSDLTEPSYGWKLLHPFRLSFK